MAVPQVHSGHSGHERSDRAPPQQLVLLIHALSHSPCLNESTASCQKEQARAAVCRLANYVKHQRPGAEGSEGGLNVVDKGLQTWICMQGCSGGEIFPFKFAVSLQLSHWVHCWVLSGGGGDARQGPRKEGSNNLLGEGMQLLG